MSSSCTVQANNAAVAALTNYRAIFKHYVTLQTHLLRIRSKTFCFLLWFQFLCMNCYKCFVWSGDIATLAIYTMLLWLLFLFCLILFCTQSSVIYNNINWQQALCTVENSLTMLFKFQFNSWFWIEVTNKAQNLKRRIKIKSFFETHTFLCCFSHTNNI